MYSGKRSTTTSAASTRLHVLPGRRLPRGFASSAAVVAAATASTSRHESNPLHRRYSPRISTRDDAQGGHRRPARRQLGHGEGHGHGDDGSGSGDVVVEQHLNGLHQHRLPRPRQGQGGGGRGRGRAAAQGGSAAMAFPASGLAQLGGLGFGSVGPLRRPPMVQSSLAPGGPSHSGSLTPSPQLVATPSPSQVSPSMQALHLPFVVPAANEDLLAQHESLAALSSLQMDEPQLDSAAPKQPSFSLDLDDLVSLDLDLDLGPAATLAQPAAESEEPEREKPVVAASPAKDDPPAVTAGQPAATEHLSKSQKRRRRKRKQKLKAKGLLSDSQGDGEDDMLSGGPLSWYEHEKLNNQQRVPVTVASPPTNGTADAEDDSTSPKKKKRKKRKRKRKKKAAAEPEPAEPEPEPEAEQVAEPAPQVEPPTTQTPPPQRPAALVTNGDAHPHAHAHHAPQDSFSMYTNAKRSGFGSLDSVQAKLQLLPKFVSPRRSHQRTEVDDPKKLKGKRLRGLAKLRARSSIKVRTKSESDAAAPSDNSTRDGSVFAVSASEDADADDEVTTATNQASDADEDPWRRLLMQNRRAETYERLNSVIRQSLEDADALKEGDDMNGLVALDAGARVTMRFGTLVELIRLNNEQLLRDAAERFGVQKRAARVLPGLIERSIDSLFRP